MIITEILIIFFLLLLNAFFSLSEMAVVSASKPMLRQMAKQGNRKAELALSLAEDSGKFLSTVQVGITLVGTLAGAYGGATIADKLEEPFNQIAFINPHGEMVAVILVVTLITYFSVVMGELIPKQVALSNPEKLAIYMARPMWLIAVICSPIVSTLEYSANLSLRLLGIRKGMEEMTEAEVKAVLAEGAASGAIEHDEHQILQRVIRLADRDVKSIMTHRVDVTFIDINDSFVTIQEKIHKNSHACYPVTDGYQTNVIGIVRSQDLLDSALSSLETLSVSTHLKPANFLLEGTSCLKVLELFKTSSAHIAIVVDEYGSTEGIVTASDLLEAMVGIIHSNYDQGEDPLIVQRDDGSWLVDGNTPIDEIHLSIGIAEIQTENSYETIAGFVLYTIGKTPKLGDSFYKFGYYFEIIDLDYQRIDKILIMAANE